MLAPLLLAAIAATAQPAPTPPALWLENARVTQVSPSAPDSGHFAVYRDFDVVLPSGQRHRLYVLWMSQNQYMPEVGTVCTIRYRRGPLLRGNLHRPQREGRPDEGPFNVVEELNCGFAPVAPGPGHSRPNA